MCIRDSIIAFVRRAVLKTPLVNHDDRVKMAFSKLISAHHFNKMQLDQMCIRDRGIGLSTNLWQVLNCFALLHCGSPAEL